MELSSEEKKLLQNYFAERPIRRAYIFGSYARNEALQGSDVDIMVELDHRNPIGMKFFTYQLELAELLNRKVDRVSSEGVSKYVRPFVDKDKILIYERDAG